MLKTFVGFKGKMAAAQIGSVSFVLLAKNEKQLSILWAHIMQAVPLDPRGIKSAILIESSLLPDRRDGQTGPVAGPAPEKTTTTHEQ